MNSTALILRFFEINAVQFGNFTLKTGLHSPFYLDFRKIVSYPDLLKEICVLLAEKAASLQYDILCGVPYAALSLASGVSLLNEKPQIIKRKERKVYGNKQMIEGVYRVGDVVLLLEDIVTSGASLLETIEELENGGLQVSDCLALVDRQQGGKNVLHTRGYRLHTLFTITQIFETLLQNKKISQEVYDNCCDYIAANTLQSPPPKANSVPPPLNYAQQLSSSQQPVQQKLLQIALEKQSNLVLSADVDTLDALFDLAEQVGEHIVMLKTHTDIFANFDTAAIERLQQLAQQHRFLLMEDRKFGDIGNTVQKQFLSPQYQLNRWADCVTVHCIAGASSIEALSRITDAGLIIIAQMSTKDTLTDEVYQQKAIEIAEKYPQQVMGVVAQSKKHRASHLLQFTPGVHLASAGDDKGQSYHSPRAALLERNADFVIVGRGIYEAANPAEAARAYREAAWQAYMERVETQVG